ncbi:hypothetical protein [Okeania sp.]|uniref:DUF6312 domain-containing protein n=1 Tax=Okeania sp. TaxID=3100323 RepID=UPI002B4B82F4|nr:hypothetical protein [Okeania sp.]MEB3341931.1 hypothetical protein [Okeania sp.]
MASDKKIKAVTVLRSDADFGGIPDTISGSKKTKKKKKKQSIGMLEKPVLDLAKQFDKATTAYREGHEKSNSKKRDGWIKDLPKNSTKALGKFKIPFSPF